MRIFWYWPFPHRVEEPLAAATPLPGDDLVLQSLRTWGGRSIETPIRSYRVLRQLPEPSPLPEGSPRWMASRMGTYLARAAAREAAIRRERPDVCHIHALNYFTDPLALRSIARRTPLISSVHDVVPHQPRLPSPFERRLLASMYRHAGTMVVAHDYLRNRLLEEFAIDPARIRVIPLPVPPVDPQPDDAERDHPPTVLFFGTMRRNKGVDVLLQAVRLLDGVEELRVRFAGRGAKDVEQAVMEAARRDPRIHPDLRFIPDDEKDKYYRRASLVVLPYTSFASQSGVLADAYAYGLPVVATDVGALGPSVREDGTGWVVPPGDPVALAEAIHTALSDPQQRRKLGEAARQVGQARSYANIGRAFRDLYDEVTA